MSSSSKITRKDGGKEEEETVDADVPRRSYQFSCTTPNVDARENILSWCRRIIEIGGDLKDTILVSFDNVECERIEKDCATEMSKEGVRVRGVSTLSEGCAVDVEQGTRKSGKPLSWRKVATLGSEIARALEMLHEEEIFHGNIRVECLRCKTGSKDGHARDSFQLVGLLPLVVGADGSFDALWKGDIRSLGRLLFSLSMQMSDDETTDSDACEATPSFAKLYDEKNDTFSVELRDDCPDGLREFFKQTLVEEMYLDASSAKEWLASLAEECDAEEGAEGSGDKDSAHADSGLGAASDTDDGSNTLLAAAANLNKMGQQWKSRSTFRRLSFTGTVDSVKDALDPAKLRQLFKQQHCLSVPDALLLLAEAIKIFRSESTVLRLESPINICGDIHGQYYDLLTLFDFNDGDSSTSKESYLFLGDYVDRGRFSCEVLFYLLALKVRYPDRMYMLRGNHECRDVSSIYGFREETLAKYGFHVYNRAIRCFRSLPLAAVIDDETFCVHGGISPEMTRVSDIDALDRFREPPDAGLMLDLLWADPLVKSFGVSVQEESSDDSEEEEEDDDGEESKMWLPNRDRGCSVLFSKDALRKFLDENGLRCLVRGHQLQDSGVNSYGATEREVETGKSTLDDSVPLITVFSAPNYCSRWMNDGGFVRLGRKSQVGRTNAHRWLVCRFDETPHPGVPEWPHCHEVQSKQLRELLAFVPETFSSLLSAARRYGNEKHPVAQSMSPSTTTSPMDERRRPSGSLINLAVGAGHNEAHPSSIRKKVRSNKSARSRWRIATSKVVAAVRLSGSASKDAPDVHVLDTIFDDNKLRFAALKLLFQTLDRDDDGSIGIEDLIGFAFENGEFVSPKDAKELIRLTCRSTESKCIQPDDFLRFAMILWKHRLDSVEKDETTPMGSTEPITVIEDGDDDDEVGDGCGVGADEDDRTTTSPCVVPKGLVPKGLKPRKWAASRTLRSWSRSRGRETLQELRSRTLPGRSVSSAKSSDDAERSCADESVAASDSDANIILESESDTHHNPYSNFSFEKTSDDDNDDDNDDGDDAKAGADSETFPPPPSSSPKRRWIPGKTLSWSRGRRARTGGSLQAIRARKLAESLAKRKEREEEAQENVDETPPTEAPKRRWRPGATVAWSRGKRSPTGAPSLQASRARALAEKLTKRNAQENVDTAAASMSQPPKRRWHSSKVMSWSRSKSARATDVVSLRRGATETVVEMRNVDQDDDFEDWSTEPTPLEFAASSPPRDNASTSPSNNRVACLRLLRTRKSTSARRRQSSKEEDQCKIEKLENDKAVLIKSLKRLTKIVLTKEENSKRLESDNVRLRATMRKMLRLRSEEILKVKLESDRLARSRDFFKEAFESRRNAQNQVLSAINEDIPSLIALTKEFRRKRVVCGLELFRERLSSLREI